MTPLLRPAIIGIVSIKFAALTIGYIGYVVASPPGEHSRKSCLAHARRTLDKHPPADNTDANAREALDRDFADLERNIVSGWRTPAEVAAFVRIMRAAISVDARVTAHSMSELSGNYGKDLWNFVRRSLPSQRYESEYFS